MSGGNPSSDLAFVALEPSSGRDRTSKNYPDSEHSKSIPTSYSDAEYWSDAYLEAKSAEPFLQFLESVMNFVGGASNDYYYTNSKKCHNIEANNKEATEANETARTNCSTYLEPELESVNPSVIVAIGGRSVQAVRSCFEVDLTSKLKESALTVTNTEPAIIPSYHWAARLTDVRNCESFHGDSWPDYYQVLGDQIAGAVNN